MTPDDPCKRMILDQIVARGITERRLLAALHAVPRREFVPPHLADRAYDDAPLPIESGQTISQPYTTAFMVQALHLKGDETVLDVGTGSGYAAAVLAKLARHVHSVEIDPVLARTAAERLRRLGFHNVTVHQGDGTLGLPQFAPYDAILVSAGGTTLPPTYPEQLRTGGRIVIPLDDGAGGQEMHRFTRLNGELRDERLGAFAFVPLVGKYGWDTTPHAPDASTSRKR